MLLRVVTPLLFMASTLCACYDLPSWYTNYDASIDSGRDAASDSGEDSSYPSDASSDASYVPDASPDASHDAGIDGGRDGGIRTGCDAGPFDDGGGSVLKGVDYVLLAWNDLGMHELNPDYERGVLAPPYNTLWAQAVQRGTPPSVVTGGLSVDYRVIGNTYSYCKGDFGAFWDNAEILFGVKLVRDRGLNFVTPSLHNGLAGGMVVSGGDHFAADGIPAVPINDIQVWNPYQTAEFTLRNGATKLAQTRATLPVSDEINCGKCHGAEPFTEVLLLHDTYEGTHLSSAKKPVLCASCHGSPILGQTGPGSSGKYFSGAMHGYHADKGAACYDCHPGVQTKFSRSTKHTATDGKCAACHGSMSDVASSVNTGARIPWKQEPKCVTCHNTGVPEVDTGATLYRDARGHGGLSCAACHGSPHAMTPSSVAADNYQFIQHQNKAVAMGSCRACHKSSKGAGSISEFAETHGGANPEHKTACNTCHTAVPVPVTTSLWPHQFQWKTRN
jgi:hypothetical protein